LQRSLLFVFTVICEIKTTKIWNELQHILIFAVRKKNQQQVLFFKWLLYGNYSLWFDVKKLKIRKINLAEIKRLVHLHSQLKRGRHNSQKIFESLEATATRIYFGALGKSSE
jgi:hypothetical protein